MKKLLNKKALKDKKKIRKINLCHIVKKEKLQNKKNLLRKGQNKQFNLLKQTKLIKKSQPKLEDVKSFGG